MAFADPLVINIGGDALSLNKVQSGPSSSTYRSSDGVYSVQVSHIYGKRVKSRFRLTVNSTSADPYNSERNIPYSTSYDVMLDRDPLGVEAAVTDAVFASLFAYLTASSGAATTKFTLGQY
jgi:hypothetical protein